MAPPPLFGQFGLLAAAGWLADRVLMAFFPWLRGWVDPLLLLLIFLGLRWPSPRFLWLHGLFLGMLRDLSAGGIFGGWACVFGLVGWALTAVRHLVEARDPLVVGLCAGLGTLLASFLYTVLIPWVDPAAWGHELVRVPSWIPLPFQAVVQGALAVWAFPRLSRLLGLTSRSSALL